MENSIRDIDIHEPTTSLICIENTHNACGGKVLSLAFMKNLRDLSRKHNLPVHMDGARIWNALTKQGTEPSEIGSLVDSLSVCLSKGLGAPIGSLLVGDDSLIKKARRVRKALGGGMRQVGLLGAAGLVALDDFSNGILKNDHIRMERLQLRINNLSAFKFGVSETNIVFGDIIACHPGSDLLYTSLEVSKLLKERGLLVSAWATHIIRIVVFYYVIIIK